MKKRMTMSNKVKIGFTGDFSFSAYFSGAEERENLIDQKILDFLGENDANVLNFESPITDCRMTKKRRLAHRSDPKVLNYVKETIKSPILSLANNHMMDYNRIGMIDTLENVEKAEIPYIGAGRNKQEAAKYVIVGDQVKVGIFAIQYKDYRVAGTRYSGPLHDKRKETIQNTINELRELVDYVVLVYHGGDEFLHAPMPYFRKRMRKYLNMGCDVVVAHHPHVVEGYEYFGDKCIFYSLGNFMFDTDYQRMQEDSDRGVVLRLIFDENGFKFENIFSRVDRDTCTVKITDNGQYFDDYAKVNYKRLWCTEAARKPEILEKAAVLREKELAEMEQAKLEREEYIESLKQKYEEDQDSYLDNDGSDDEQDDASNEESLEGQSEKKKKSSWRKTLRKIKKKVTNKKTYESMVIKMGAAKARMFYK